ncbi:MAG: hypothetical protein ACK4TL_12630 [Hyphomicrobiaceae bacterium]
MADPPNALVLDLVEWIAKAPRPYAEVMDAWRTSCPRLTIWEDAIDGGYVATSCRAHGGVMVSVTDRGRALLQANARTQPPA